jgi:putative transposase
MHLTWKNRLETASQLRDIRQWPVIDSHSLPNKLRRDFLRNQRIAARVLKGTSLSRVAHEFALAVSTIYHIMDRCLGGSPQEEPALTAGLVPYTHIRKNQRRQPLATLGSPRGDQSAFTALLTALPQIRTALDQMMLAHIDDQPNAEVFSIKACHGRFKWLLAEHQWPTDTYPYTNPSEGYESLRKYVKQRYLELDTERQLNRLRAVTELQFEAPPGLFNRLETDEHKIDAKANIHLILNKRSTPIRLGAASFMLTVHKDSDCYLAYHLALTQHPNLEDMLQLLDHLISPWQPLELQTPGFDYAPGARIPDCVNDANMALIFGVNNLDNALLHSARPPREVITTQLSSIYHTGLPGQPRARECVERAFNRLNQQVSHRLPSTTGSHSKDPKRESAKNQKQPPCVTFRALEEAIELAVTEHNVTPQPHLDGATPLEAWQLLTQAHYVPMTPPSPAPFNLFSEERSCIVYSNQKDGGLPYINFEHLRYKGPGLLDASLFNQKIRIRFDRRDIRSVQAFTDRGKSLGTIRAPKTWQHSPHGVTTRRYIFKLVKQKRLRAPDLLAGYMEYLLNNRHHEKQALTLLRAHRELYPHDLAAGPPSGAAVLSTFAEPPMSDPPTLERKDALAVIKPWETDWVKHNQGE